MLREEGTDSVQAAAPSGYRAPANWWLYLSPGRTKEERVLRQGINSEVGCDDNGPGLVGLGPEIEGRHGNKVGGTATSASIPHFLPTTQTLNCVTADLGER